MNKTILMQRRVLGILGALLPILCLIAGALFNGELHPAWYYTISATFFTPAITIFVGLLFSVGIFLITYLGYDWRDRLINIISGVSALGIAIFPCSTTTLTKVGLFSIPVGISAVLHGLFAGIFFVSLAVNILWLFTKTNGEISEGKYKRNILYKVCGFGILAFIILMVFNILLNIWGPLSLIAETFMLLFFATAWLVKGEFLLKDK